MSHRRTIDVQDGDDAWIKEFEKQLDLLCGMTIEMMGEERQLLLSQTFRHVLLEKAKLVKEMSLKVNNKLCVDNLGKPLKEATDA